MDVEAEIRDLKRRVGELEGGFGFLTQQVQAVHRDLLGFQEQANQRFEKVEAAIEDVKAEVRGVKAEVSSLKAEVSSVKADVAGLRKDLPTIVADVMREVLREQR